MSADEGFERAPDGIDPLVGYPVWQVQDEDDEPVFLPLMHPSRDWKGATRGWVSASCSVGADELFVSADGELAWGPIPHRVPGEGCFCGFYAMKELDAQLLHAVTMASDAADRAGMMVFVLGRVELAGKVIEHELGYRAEQARIVELIPLRGQERIVEAIAQRAGVSVGQPVKCRRTPIRDLVRREGGPRGSCHHGQVACSEDDRTLELLHALAGPDATFHPGQREAIEAVVAERRRVLLVQRTGWGKSAVTSSRRGCSWTQALGRRSSSRRSSR